MLASRLSRPVSHGYPAAIPMQTNAVLSQRETSKHILIKDKSVRLWLPSNPAVCDWFPIDYEGPFLMRSKEVWRRRN